MAVQLDFHPKATEELEDATRWYADRSPKAAAGFVAAVERAVDSILATPLRFARVGRQCRGCSLVGYPYQIVFRCDSNRVQVVAVAHAKRRPGYWARRELDQP